MGDTFCHHTFAAALRSLSAGLPVNLLRLFARVATKRHRTVPAGCGQDIKGNSQNAKICVAALLVIG